MSSRSSTMPETSDCRRSCFPGPKDVIMPGMSNPGSDSPVQEMDLPVLDTADDDDDDDDGTADFLLLSDAEVLKSPTLAKVRKAIDRIAERLRDSLYPNQFLVLSDLGPGIINKLEDPPRALKPDAIFRLTTYPHLAKATVRIMPSRHHDQIATSFNIAVGIRLDRMGLDMDGGHWAGVGSSRFRGRNCAKEADMGIIPGPHIGADANNIWPSIVAEVGVSESLNPLRADAQWWWSNSGHQTAVIVLFAVRRAPSPSVSVEMWTAQQVPVQGRETRQRSREIAGSHPTALVLRRDQNVTITPAAGANALLRIPFQSVMRRPPVGTETDIVIDARALFNICRAVF